VQGTEIENTPTGVSPIIASKFLTRFQVQFKGMKSVCYLERVSNGQYSCITILADVAGSGIISDITCWSFQMSCLCAAYFLWYGLLEPIGAVEDGILLQEATEF
jgi:hypothetical protein